jgi:hypothetical protein
MMMLKRSAFGAKATTRPVVRAQYKVTLKTPSGEQTIECSPDTYILDGEKTRSWPALAATEGLIGGLSAFFSPHHHNSPRLSSPLRRFPPPSSIQSTAAEEAG